MNATIGWVLITLALLGAIAVIGSMASGARTDHRGAERTAQVDRTIVLLVNIAIVTVIGTALVIA